MRGLDLGGLLAVAPREKCATLVQMPYIETDAIQEIMETS